MTIHPANKMKHLHPKGAQGFSSLPCCYGHLMVPATRALTSMALCQMNLPPFGESRDAPEEKGHYHERMTEIYCFIQGTGRMLLNGHWQNVRRGSILLVPPMVMHTVRAGAEGAECLVWTVPAYNPADMFDLFDYPPQFSRFDPTWIKILSDMPPSQSPVLHDLFETPEYEFGFVHLAPRVGVPLHQHDCKEEAYFILSGSAHMVLGDQAMTIEPGYMVSIPEHVKHSITAGPEGVSYLEAGVWLPALLRGRRRRCARSSVR